MDLDFVDAPEKLKDNLDIYEVTLEILYTTKFYKNSHLGKEENYKMVQSVN